MEEPKGLRILKALHGDAFVLTCRKGGNKGVIVVDGGPEPRRTLSEVYGHII